MGNVVAADGVGAGLGLRDASPTIEGNEIRDNDACYEGPESGCDGGGLAIRGGSPTVADNLITGNGAGDGGGMWLVRTEGLFFWNLIDGNFAHDTDPEEAGQGGGVDIQIGDADMVFVNNIVSNNVASTHGGGLAVYEYSATYGSPTIEHNVIAYNAVDPGGFGGGLLAFGTTVPLFRNNLVIGNEVSGIYLNNTATARYNLVWANTTDWAGPRGSRTGLDGNVAADPRVNAASDDGNPTNDDWHPLAGSPLLDAGDPASATDIDGSRADIGAHGGTYGGW